MKEEIKRGPKCEASILFNPIVEGGRVYTRKVKIKLQANSAVEFRHLIEQKIIPLLRAQKGFRDEIVLIAAERDEAIAISFWDNQESAETYNHVAYLDVLRALSRVIKSVPTVETFAVVDSTVLAIGSKAA